jgi:hypothetical protein
MRLAPVGQVPHLHEPEKLHVPLGARKNLVRLTVATSSPSSMSLYYSYMALLEPNKTL